MKHYLPILLMLLSSFVTMASNQVREQHIAQQIKDRIDPGKPIWLEVEGVPFLSIHTESKTKQIRGGVLLLHDLGANPDWTDVIHPLRVKLADTGFETLSLQLPVAASDASPRDYQPLIPEAGPRIFAAIGFFKSKRNLKNLVLLGHGLGARMGLEFLSGEVPEEIRGFVAISLSTLDPPDEGLVIAQISKVGVPLFDIYGSRDLASVSQGASKRRTAALQANQSNFRQDRVEGANHFFHGVQITLEQRVGAWLSRLATSFKD